jgi:hypothetical protein
VSQGKDADRLGVRRVHVRDARGSLLFNRLEDSGGEQMRFASGHGWVNKYDLAAHGWTLHAGWPSADAEAEAA